MFLPGDMRSSDGGGDDDGPRAGLATKTSEEKRTEIIGWKRFF